MVEPKRAESVPLDAVDRDSQAEALLVDGLDRYFNGRYEDAIHLWTRVLFIDRSHARARAYIDRARSAMAERQRHADELLATSRALLDRGQPAAARQLLSEVVASAGEDEHASALRIRLERVERAHAGTASLPAAAPPRPAPVRGWSWPRHSRAMASPTLLVLAAVVAGGILTPAVQQWLALGPRPEVLRPAAGPVKLPVLSSAEVALVRARTLFDRGRLAEALAELDRMGVESPVRPAADALRMEIQQLLLANSRGSSGSSAEPPRR